VTARETTALPPLPDGYSVRRPSRGDLPEIAAVVAAAELDLIGEVVTTADDLVRDWNFANFALDRDAWLMATPSGDPVAYAWCHSPGPNADPDAFLVVHPQHATVEISAHLLALILRRAGDIAVGELDRTDPTLGMWCARQDAARRELYQAAGFKPTRVFYGMTIDAAEIPDLLPWPAGIAIRTLRRPDDERPVHAAVQEAFAQHFREFPEKYDDWRRRVFAHPSLDLDLWFVAWDADEVAGDLLAMPGPGRGEVDQLAVRAAWRRRGLGAALLVHAFHALRDRGFERVVLGVDAENTTGALGLYERVGMRVQYSFDFFEKPLASR